MKADTPFRLDSPLKETPIIGPLMLGLAERALAFERLANIYRQLVDAGNQTAAEFSARALQLLEVDFDVDHAQLEHIPATGPAIVVANARRSPYFSDTLAVRGSEAADLRVSAVINLSDEQTVLAALARQLPIHVQKSGEGVTEITMRR
jgi:hypothetical protein